MKTTNTKNRIDRDALLKSLEAVIAKHEDNAMIAGKVNEAYQKIKHHKKITKKLADEIKKVLPGYAVSMNYSSTLGWFELKIWKSNFNDSIMMLFKTWEELEKQIFLYSMDNKIGTNSYRQAQKEIANLNQLCSAYEAIQGQITALKDLYGIEQFGENEVSYTLQEFMPLLKKYI
jgi:hypothetical protein